MRSIRDRFPFLHIVALALVCASGAASAHAAPVTVPGDAPTVFGPTASGTTIIAFVHGKDLCVAMQWEGQARPDRVAEPVPDNEQAGNCVTLPVLPAFGHEGIATLRTSTGGIAIGVTGRDAASVELRHEGKVVGRSATASLPLPVAAGDLRIYAAELPESEADINVFVDPDEVAVRDAAGTLRWVDDSRAFPELGRETVLRRGRAFGERWRLAVARRRVLEATPLEPDRHVEEVCPVLTVGAGSIVGGPSVTGPCDRPGVAQALTVELTDGCAAQGNGVVVVARRAVRRAVALLGDGRRVTVPLMHLTGATAGTRTGVLFAGGEGVIRHVAGLGAGGREVARLDLGLAPLRRSDACDEGSNGGDVFFTWSTDPDPLGAGPHAARIVDAGAQVCVAVDRAPRVPDDCRLAPTTPSGADVSAYPTADGTHLVGVANLDVAAARMTLDDGTKLTVAAVPPVGYVGRYKDVLRVIEADLPAPRRALSQELLDARGRVLEDAPGPQTRPLTGVTALGRPAGVSTTLRAGLLHATSGSAVRVCVTLGELAERGDCFLDANPSAPDARLVVDCARSRTLVIALLPRSTDRLLVPTSAGRTVTARTIRLPARLRRGGAAAVAVAYLPSREGAEALTFHGSHPRRVRLGLPPGARQCGYAVTSYPRGLFPF
ncbi:hypothetical protein [Baekduia sp. Peel2402]|uniref:hypothetical protein n=1 Tax=Baekduia sp. Peel2402 TaxID=3458296 RepID=UPI00403E4D70